MMQTLCVLAATAVASLLMTKTSLPHSHICGKDLLELLKNLKLLLLSSSKGGHCSDVGVVINRVSLSYACPAHLVPRVAYCLAHHRDP